MKKKCLNAKDEKGITIVALIITIIIISIITSIVVYNVSTNISTAKLKNMKNDIENLRDKIENYYSKNGTIPIIGDDNCKYTNVTNLQSVIGANDSNDFYVIDLSKIENLTLNYGSDFEEIKNIANPTSAIISTYTDVYIINKRSHNVFYVEGVEVDNEKFYTNYNANQKDTILVEKRD